MDIYPDMYQIFKHPTKKNRRRVVIQDRELREIFELNTTAGSYALFTRKLSSGQVRPYSAQEEFCNSEELGSIINVYEGVARDAKRYWNILNAVVIGKEAILQANGVAKAVAQEGAEAYHQAMKDLVRTHTDPYVQKAKEIEEVNENWVGDLAGKLPEVPKKKTKKGKKDICWTTLEDAKKIVGKEENEKQSPPYGVGACGHCYQDEFVPECPVHGKKVLELNTCPDCGEVVVKSGACSKCHSCGWSEGCS
jgi:hypothetical protein